MKFAFVVPFAREREFVELARLGEDSDWDMVCTWEPVSVRTRGVNSPPQP